MINRIIQVFCIACVIYGILAASVALIKFGCVVAILLGFALCLKAVRHE